jgi:hypothetical protein
MEYEIFFQKFGGSARTKNVVDGETSRVWNKRAFKLPGKSGLPKGFIRLCPWEMEYVFAVARRARKGILEVGRLNGGSTFLFACANSEVPIRSIDIQPVDDALLKTFFEANDVGSNVQLIVANSAEPRKDLGSMDVIFIDGDHEYKGVSDDIATWYPHLAENGHLLFHDSYLGYHGVQDAVLDFLELHPELEILVSPFIGPTHWHYQAGSIAHLWKRVR